jgi:hypothetical protein
MQEIYGFKFQETQTKIWPFENLLEAFYWPTNQKALIKSVVISTLKAFEF